jgi:hypothetical protein
MTTTWVITSDENGGEYAGYLYVTAINVIQVDNCTIMADTVRIQIDEHIRCIETEEKHNER